MWALIVKVALVTSPLSDALDCRSYAKRVRYKSCRKPWHVPVGFTHRLNPTAPSLTALGDCPGRREFHQVCGRGGPDCTPTLHAGSAPMTPRTRDRKST